jgi:hypothetical protein
MASIVLSIDCTLAKTSLEVAYFEFQRKICQNRHMKCKKEKECKVDCRRIIERTMEPCQDE